MRTRQREVEQSYTVEVSGKRFDVRVVGAAVGRRGAVRGHATAQRQPRGVRRPSAASGSPRAQEAAPDTLPSPLQGNMWKVLVKQGDTVQEGQLLCIIEAMKMENEITAHKAGDDRRAADHRGRADRGGRPDRNDHKRLRVV